MEVVAWTFKQLWQMGNGFRVYNQGNNIVLFVFDNLMEVDKILKSQLWSFDKHLILMQCYSSDVLVTELVFEKVPFLGASS